MSIVETTLCACLSHQPLDEAVDWGEDETAGEFEARRMADETWWMEVAGEHEGFCSRMP